MTTACKSFDDIVASVQTMDESEVKDNIAHFHGRFKIDFTEEYLDNQPVEKLRHILLAALATTMS